MDIRDLQHIFTKKLTLRRNKFLKTQHSIDTNIYFIENGSLKISIFKENEEQIIRFGYTDNLIVALDSFIQNSSSEFVIQAIKKTELWVAEKSTFIQYVFSSPEHTKQYIQLLEELVLQQLEREKDLLEDSPKERYRRVFERNPKLFQLIPSKHIANYLRMSAETLSRLKKS